MANRCLSRLFWGLSGHKLNHGSMASFSFEKENNYSSHGTHERSILHKNYVDYSNIQMSGFIHVDGWHTAFLGPINIHPPRLS